MVETGIVFEADIVRWLEKVGDGFKIWRDSLSLTSVKDPKIPQGECSGGFRLLYRSFTSRLYFLF